ncbi:MAG: hypothetical protein Q4G69_05995 [Planctomycetia bacterium]|nr:hypothetical protein [Planctomycetia bacterium]
MKRNAFINICVVVLVLFGSGKIFTKPQGAENSANTMAVELSAFPFKPAPRRSGTGMRLEQIGPNSIRFAMTSAKDFGSESIIANVDYVSMAQQKLVFRVKGRPENGTAFFHPVLLIQNGSRTKAISGPRIPANGGDWHLYVLGLDTDFQLGDARYPIKGLEFSFNSAREPLEKDLSVEVDKIRLVNPNEIADRKKFRFQICRAAEGQFPRSSANSSCLNQKANIDPQEKRIAVYFDFDNNDVRSGISMSRTKKADIPDEYCGDFGYRDLLLEHCPLFTLAGKPEEADLIVYQRTLPSDHAAEVARLVRGGKPLVLYGSIPDPEIAKIAPMELSRLPNDQFADREKLINKTASLSSESAAALASSLPIQDCTFGRYFSAKPIKDASVLLSFAGSKDPYLVQKGNILHFAGTSGTNLIESPVFYDKAALIFWAAISGIQKPLEKIALYESVQPKEKIRKEDGLTWHQTTKGFGRFGWLTAEPGLVDSVSSDLTVFNGDQMYRIDVCRTAQESEPNAGSEQTNSDKKSDTAIPLCPLQGYCNEISKEYQFTSPETGGKISFTMSLLSPFELWRFDKSDRIFLTQENIADYAVWKTEQGIKIISLKDQSKTKTIWDESRDGRWSAPWMLLFRENDARPLLVVFPSQPKKIAATVRYGLIEGFEIIMGKEKTILAGWPWGLISRDCSGWNHKIPDPILKKIDEVLGLALHFPIDRTESFALDPAKGRIRFRTDLHCLSFANDWNKDVKPIVCLPPLTAYMLHLNNKDKYPETIFTEKGKIAAGKNGGLFEKTESLPVPLVQTDEILRNFDIPTPFGPMIGKSGSSVQWSLPLPDSRDLLMPSVKNSKFNALQNKLFQDGVKWTCGGHVPLNRLSPEKPSGPESDDPNISHFTWNFGMGTALQSGLLLNSESRRLMERRAAIRTVEPMELYQHKAFVRHRTEPFSGLHYPVMFNSFYPNEVQYEKNFGSRVIYGDTNESATVAAWTGQELADIYGLSDLIRANWSFYRYVMRHQLYIDDYCYQSGSCRESGAGAWIDMLNAEYSGLIAYARLAQIAGSESIRTEALSRAAKRAVPTLARICFKPWFERLHPEYRDRTYLITGFGEEGAKTMIFPTRSGNFAGANDLFDYSQGVPGTQFHLYRKYVRKPVEEYLREIAFPQLTGKDQRPGYPYLGPLSWYGSEEKQINEYAAAVFARPENQKAEDWPGMCWAFEIGAWLWRMNGQIAFSRFENLNFISAQYDPDTHRLRVRLIGRSDSRLELTSREEPQQAVNNSKPIKIELERENGMIFMNIPIGEGINRLEIQFKEQ